MTIEECTKRMTEILKAAGKTGLTGAEICAKLGTRVDSQDADMSARALSRMPTQVIGLRGSAQVYAWCGEGGAQ